MAKDDEHEGSSPKHARRALLSCVTIFLLLAGVTALTVWLVYRPHKPRFTVAGVAVFNLNNTTPPLFICPTMQFSIVTTNPNKRVSILYDHLSVFVSYRNQMITQPVMLPPLFHEKHSTVELAPILGSGAPVPVSAEVWYGWETEEAYGVVGMRLVLLGKLRWKAGAITTGRYEVYVKCDVLLRLSQGFVGQVPFVAPPACQVDV